MHYFNLLLIHCCAIWCPHTIAMLFMPIFMLYSWSHCAWACICAQKHIECWVTFWSVPQIHLSACHQNSMWLITLLSHTPSCACTCKPVAIYNAVMSISTVHMWHTSLWHACYRVLQISAFLQCPPTAGQNLKITEYFCIRKDECQPTL